MIDFRKDGAAIGLVGAGILILVMVVVNIRSIVSIENAEKRLDAAIEAFQQKTDQLESRINTIGARVHQEISSGPTVIGSLSKPKSPKKPPVDASIGQSQRESTESRTAATEGMDMEVLKEIYDKAIAEKDMEDLLGVFREFNRAQLEVDKALYGDGPEETFRALVNRNPANRLSDDDREALLNDLIDQYPDSFAAAKAVSAEVINSIRNNNIPKAEALYNTLLNLQEAKGENIVLNSGYEAVPTVTSALAYSYYRSGETDKIQPLIDRLANTYSDSPIRIRPRGGAPTNITGQEAADRLRRTMGID